MEITVYDLSILSVAGSEAVRVYSEAAAENGCDGIVFDGTFDEVMISDWSDYVIDSFWIENGVLVVNVMCEL